MGRKHRKFLAKWNRQYYQNNTEEIAERKKQYFQTPTGKAIRKTIDLNRRALEKGLTKEIILRVYEDNIAKYGILTCYLCGKHIVKGNKKLKDSLDHSTPLIRGGSNKYENLGIAHQVCNLQKGTKTLSEWFENQSLNN